MSLRKFNNLSYYYAGDVVEHFGNEYLCLVPVWSPSTFKKYSYLPNRTKVYYWRNLTHNPATLGNNDNPYYGDCSQQIPRPSDRLKIVIQTYDEYYENLTFYDNLY